jgi:hypothetical protein
MNGKVSKPTLDFLVNLQLSESKNFYKISPEMFATSEWEKLRDILEGLIQKSLIGFSELDLDIPKTTIEENMIKLDEKAFTILINHLSIDSDS